MNSPILSVLSYIIRRPIRFLIIAAVIALCIFGIVSVLTSYSQYSPLADKWSSFDSQCGDEAINAPTNTISCRNAYRKLEVQFIRFYLGNTSDVEPRNCTLTCNNISGYPLRIFSTGIKNVSYTEGLTSNGTAHTVMSDYDLMLQYNATNNSKSNIGASVFSPSAQEGFSICHQTVSPVLDTGNCSYTFAQSGDIQSTTMTTGYFYIPFYGTSAVPAQDTTYDNAHSGNSPDGYILGACLEGNSMYILSNKGSTYYTQISQSSIMTTGQNSRKINCI